MGVNFKKIAPGNFWISSFINMPYTEFIYLFSDLI